MSDRTTVDPILIEGPWEHRTVHAHGLRFHVALQGEGPLVLFVHGFPNFWWMWRRLLGPVAEAGFTAAALDMRGYGATDHPPRGYDPRTLASDISGVISALGYTEAIVVGHGWGGIVGWTAATLQANNVRGLAAIGSVHPNSLRRAMMTSPSQMKALSYVSAYQAPRIAEMALTKNGGHKVGELLQNWTAPLSISKDDLAIYQTAFLQGNTAYCALESHRWALRSIPRPDGRSFAKAMNQAVSIPVLHIHGENDPSVLIETAQDSEQFTTGDFQFEEIAQGNHLLTEQCPEEIESILLTWLGTLSV